MIDLHTHSVYSDGCESPETLVRLAKAAGVRAIALTDHDTTAGLDDFMAACRREGIMGITGVEIGAQVSVGTLHILGLGFDPENEALSDMLVRIRRSRDDRNYRILAKLNDLGFNLTWDEVQSFAGDDVVGRPHFARAMIARGWAESVGEVFERFLENGAPAYVDRLKPSPTETISLIRDAGGIAVVAHPFTWLDDAGALEAQLAILKSEGLVGVEVYHSSHSDEDVLELARIAKRLELLPTGGTDFHGEEVKPSIAVGKGAGNMAVSEDLLPPLLKLMEPKGFQSGSEVFA